MVREAAFIKAVEHDQFQHPESPFRRVHSHPRGLGRHFRRLAMLDSLTGTGVSREVPPSLSQSFEAAKSTPDELLVLLDSTSSGLSEAQSEAARERFV